MTTKGQKASVVNSYYQQHFVSVPHILFTHKCWCFLVCAGVSSHVDDEYKWAGVEDPKVMVTTSRDPSSRLKMFAKVRSLSEHKHVEASKTLLQHIFNGMCSYFNPGSSWFSEIFLYITDEK